MKSIFAVFATIAAVVTMTASHSALALESGPLNIAKNSDGTTYVQVGGLIVPGSEAVADTLVALTKGRHTCQAKWFRSTHQGVWAYTLFDLADCN
jgi:hypothetical protein